MIQISEGVHRQGKTTALRGRTEESRQSVTLWCRQPACRGETLPSARLQRWGRRGLWWIEHLPRLSTSVYDNNSILVTFSWLVRNKCTWRATRSWHRVTIRGPAGEEGFQFKERVVTARGVVAASLLLLLLLLLGWVGWHVGVWYPQLGRHNAADIFWFCRGPLRYCNLEGEQKKDQASWHRLTGLGWRFETNRSLLILFLRECTENYSFCTNVTENVTEATN